MPAQLVKRLAQLRCLGTTAWARPPSRGRCASSRTRGWWGSCRDGARLSSSSPSR